MVVRLCIPTLERGNETRSMWKFLAMFSILVFKFFSWAIQGGSSEGNCVSDQREKSVDFTKICISDNFCCSASVYFLPGSNIRLRLQNLLFKIYELSASN